MATDDTPPSGRWISVPRKTASPATPEDARLLTLNPIEQASAFAALQAEGKTQAEIGRRLGKGQSYVARKLRLLRLPALVQEAIVRGDLTEGKAQELVQLNDPNRQVETAEFAIAHGTPVGVLAEFVDLGGVGKPTTSEEAQAERERQFRNVEHYLTRLAVALREQAVKVAPSQRQTWASSHDMSPDELKELLAYTDGPLPKALMVTLLKRASHE